MKRTIILKIRLWWSFNNPRILLKVYNRNKRIITERRKFGIPSNFEEIQKEFTEGKRPGFLLKYPNYFYWLQKEEEIKDTVGCYCNIKKAFFQFI